MSTKAQLSKEIKPIAEELLKTELQMKKLKAGIASELKVLSTRKKDLMKQVSECMTKHKLEHITGASGSIAMVNKERQAPLNKETLVETLERVLGDPAKAVSMAVDILAQLPMVESKTVKVKPEKNKSLVSLDLNTARDASPAPPPVFEATVPEPAVPEPAVPEPAVPEPAVPEPTAPEPANAVESSP
jgi:hypothetical protein